MHSKPAQRLRIGSREAAQAHDGIGNREPELMRQIGQFIRGLAKNDASSGIDNRPFGRHHHIHGLTDLPCMPAHRRICRSAC